tara:strand:+ start:249 stop:605 length:357 start_codon:yes stop_codon:yes gene_type:complete
MSSPFQQQFSNNSPFKPLHEAQSIIDPKYPGSKQEFEQKENKKQKKFISSLPKRDGRPTQTGAINESNDHVLIGSIASKGFNLSKKIPSLFSKQIKKVKNVATNFADNIVAALLPNSN